MTATVALEATVNKAGKASSSKVLRDIPPFTAMAIRAVEDWRFIPAALDGKPLESQVVLAFSFRIPVNDPQFVSDCVPTAQTCN